MPIAQTRRRFLNTLSLASVVGLLGARPALAGEGALETTTVRLQKSAAICIAPQYIAEALLRAEGFTDIRYVDGPAGDPEPLARGKVDFDTNYASNFVRAIDAGAPTHLLVYLADGNGGFTPSVQTRESQKHKAGDEVEVDVGGASEGGHAGDTSLTLDGHNNLRAPDEAEG